MNKAEAVASYGTRISDVVHEWLADEVNSSGLDRNSYLDEYTTAVQGIKAGWDDPNNFAARKLESHLNRLPFWFEAYSLDPADDYQAARVIFAGLMQVSGAYRDQCYVQSANGCGYLQRRQKAIGIPHDLAVKMQLGYLIPPTGELSRAYVDIDNLRESMKSVSALGETAVRRLVSRVQDGHDLHKETSPSVTQMKYAQLEWLKLSTQFIIHAAKIRKGILSDVPLLEPKSISATPPPDVMYPFRDS